MDYKKQTLDQALEIGKLKGEIFNILTSLKAISIMQGNTERYVEELIKEIEEKKLTE